MNIVTIDTGGLDRIHDEQDADILVLRGATMITFVDAVSAALGRPLDTKHAPAIHGVKRTMPIDFVHRDLGRDWFLGEPMPTGFSELQAELQTQRERVWLLERQLSEARTVLDRVERVLAHTQAVTK